MLRSLTTLFRAAASDVPGESDLSRRRSVKELEAMVVREEVSG